jgi:hypothetical protein
LTLGIEKAGLTLEHLNVDQLVGSKHLMGGIEGGAIHIVEVDFAGFEVTL